MLVAALFVCSAAQAWTSEPQVKRLLPIFMMHGINDNHKEFDAMQTRIRAIDPTVQIVSLPICDDSASYTNLWDQGEQIIDHIKSAVNASPELYTNGSTLLCHSQGALTCRTVVQRFDNHSFHTFISLAGPHMGEFGIPAGWQSKIPWGRDLAYSFFLTGPAVKLYQNGLSIANFWHDPRPKAAGGIGKPATDYLAGNTFLPVFNNNPGRRTQGPGKSKDDAQAARYKRNMLLLEQAVFTASPVDDMIIPYDSAVWRFYNEDASATVPLEQTEMWTQVSQPLPRGSKCSQSSRSMHLLQFTDSCRFTFSHFARCKRISLSLSLSLPTLPPGLARLAHAE
jgi:palmitoyl-protein thioesterase